MNPWLKNGLRLLVLVLLVGIGFEVFQRSSSQRPNFSGTDLQGRPWSLADYRGRKPVIVNFFATW